MYKWKDSYSVKISKVDKQHKKLFDLFNKLHEAMKKGSADSEIKSILKSCKSYVSEHFRDEEKILKKHNYSGYNNHIKRHKEFEDKIEQKLNDTLKNKKIENTDVLEIYKYLNDWLIKHIMKEDQTYSKEITKAHDLQKETTH